MKVWITNPSGWSNQVGKRPDIRRKSERGVDVVPGLMTDIRALLELSRGNGANKDNNMSAEINRVHQYLSTKDPADRFLGYAHLLRHLYDSQRPNARALAIGILGEMKSRGYHNDELMRGSGSRLTVSSLGFDVIVGFEYAKKCEQSKMKGTDIGFAKPQVVRLYDSVSGTQAGSLKNKMSEAIRKQFAGSRQFFFVQVNEERISVEVEPDTGRPYIYCHYMPVFADYDPEGKLSLVVLDSVGSGPFFKQLKAEISGDLRDGDTVFFSSIQRQRSSTGCKIFSIRDMAATFDLLASGRDLVKEFRQEMDALPSEGRFFDLGSKLPAHYMVYAQLRATIEKFEKEAGSQIEQYTHIHRSKNGPIRETFGETVGRHTREFRGAQRVMLISDRVVKYQAEIWTDLAKDVHRVISPKKNVQSSILTDTTLTGEY
jgi:hypothetical protein